MKENKCEICENSSYDKVLVKVEIKWKDWYICVWCLPSVIHGWDLDN